MTLRVHLGPLEELHVGKCVIKSSHEMSLFAVEGSVPVLRGKDVLTEAAAQSPIEKLYRCVQQMYLEESYQQHQGRYLQLAVQSMQDDPGISSDLQAADALITTGDFHQALKTLKKLLRADAFEMKRRPSPHLPRANGWKLAQQGS